MTMRFEFTRFLNRFSDEDLEIVWDHGGLGELIGDRDAPFPGRRVMARFVVPIPGSWRDILRRAVRTMPIRRDIGALRALLIALVSHDCTPVPTPAAHPVTLTAQLHRVPITPTRGSPWASRVGEAPT